MPFYSMTLLPLKVQGNKISPCVTIFYCVYWHFNSPIYILGNTLLIFKYKDKKFTPPTFYSAKSTDQSPIFSSLDKFYNKNCDRFTYTKNKKTHLAVQ